MQTMTGCDHSALTTPFCATCGKRVGVAREPGEIRQMRERLKVAVARRPEKGDGLGALLMFIVMDSALSWAVGEMDDDALLKIARPNDEAR